MTERDANFVTLDHVMQGLNDGLGVYDIRMLSDIVSARSTALMTVVGRGSILL